MAVDIQVEGVSYMAGGLPGKYVTDFTSVSVDLDIAVQQPDAQFAVIIWDKAIPRPRAGNEVVMYAYNGAREFGGVLQIVQETEIEPDVMRYDCRCTDYTPWLDRHLVRGSFQTQTTDSLIRSIVATYVNTPGNTRTFTTNNVQPGYPTPIMQFVYQAPSQVISQLAQMTGWGWFIDSYRDIHFYSTQQFTSPLPGNLLDADDLYDDPTLAGVNGNWINLTFAEDTSQLKNRCFVTGIYVATNTLYTEQKLGDGTTTVFTLAYQPPNDISKITVNVGGTAYQVGLDLINSTPGGPCDAQTAYVNFTQQTVRFCAAPSKGAVITINYYPMLQTSVSQQNRAAQQYIASIDGTDGIYEYNRMDPSLSAELPTLANQRAYMTLLKYAYPWLSLKFTSYLQGWYPGQQFSFSSARRWDGAYQAANGTAKQFFVTRVSKKLLNAGSGGWNWIYDIDAADRPFEI